MSNRNWIDYASIDKQITSKDYTARTVEAASALFPVGTQPNLVMIVVDAAEFDDDAYAALPTTDTWKDRLVPNRQHKAALSIAKKLCP